MYNQKYKEEQTNTQATHDFCHASAMTKAAMAFMLGRRMSIVDDSSYDCPFQGSEVSRRLFFNPHAMLSAPTCDNLCVSLTSLAAPTNVL